MEAPASKVSPAMETVAIRPPTMGFRSNMWIGPWWGEYCRRKWATEAPPIPPPIMQTVGGGDWDEDDWEVERRKRRREKRRGGVAMDC